MPWEINCFRRGRRRIESLPLPDHVGQTLPPGTLHKPLKSREIAWAEGLRGLAALGVVSNHLSMCYANYLFRPCCAPVDGELSVENAAGVPHLFQLPIFRLVAAGETFVAMFLILTGFTAGHKPLGYARDGQSDKAYSSIAVSSFRRLPRLFFPATVATVFSWAMCNLGGYEMSRNGEAWWMIVLTPTQSTGPWYQAFVDLWWAIWVPWMPYGVQPYDQPQWALQYFVEAGLMVFLAVLGTARLSSTWRIIVLALWAFWSGHLSAAIRDPYVGYCTLFGMVIAELNLAVSSSKLKTKLASKMFSFFVIFIGLIIMSYPRDVPEKTSWSYALRELGEYILPFNDSKYKPMVSMGCLVFFFGAIFNSTVQKALSISPMMWLGRISFPLYLLHGTFVRSLFAWVLFAGQELHPSGRDPNVQRYPLPSNAWIVFSVICLMIPLFICCELWVRHMEPIFDKTTLWIEKTMLANSSSLPDVRSSWSERLRSITRGILLVVRNGGLPDEAYLRHSIKDVESEAEALLGVTSDPALYSPTGLFVVDEPSSRSTPYRDSEEIATDSDKPLFEKEEKNDIQI